MRFFSALMLIFIISCCATTSPKILKIRMHVQYNNLSSEEKDLTEDIMDKAINSSRKDYYFSKLTLLLDTPTNSPEEIRRLNCKAIRRSVEKSKKERREIAKKNKSDLEEYLSQEEFYESAMKRKWHGYRPTFSGPFFYIANSDPLDILIHINIRLHGNYNIIAKIILLEDAIEKYLSITGYSVNLVFVGYSNDEDDVFDVGVDPKLWPTSHNWVGSYKELAHELMHLMGLPDEYDRIENHAHNKNMTRINRLNQFIIQMDSKIFSDSSDGIMYSHMYKPLERHICASVGLDEECVSLRMEAFHEGD